MNDGGSGMRQGLACLGALVLALVASGPAHAQALNTGLNGLLLEQALSRLQQRGLRLIYSSEVVRPEMRVRAEPAGTTLRAQLDHLLNPHGLMARDGPGTTIVIIRNPRARVAAPTAPAPIPGPPPRSIPSTDAVEALRFEMTVAVAEPGAASGLPPASPLTVAPLEVAALAGGFQNVFRAVQALPGVVGTEELGSRIAVRGGSPDQNLTLLDGVEIHNPFRLAITTDDFGSVGLASTFNADTVQRIELHPGAFDVRYGDRLSSLLLVEHREGSEVDPVQGFVTAGLTDANLVLEGRLPRQAKGSWLVSARRGFVDLVPERVVGATLPSFYDVHARGLWRPRPSHHLSIVGAVSRERSRLASNTPDSGQTGRTDNTLLAITHGTHAGRISLRTELSTTHLRSGLFVFEQSLDNNRGANSPESIASGGPFAFTASRRAEIRDYSMRHDMGVVLSAVHALDAGAEAHGLDTVWAWRLAGDRSLQQANGSSIRLGQSLPVASTSVVRSVRGGAWIQDLWRLSSSVMVQPGIRLDHSSVTGATTWSPRVGATWAPGDRWRFDGAVRLHTQTPGYEKTLLSDYFLDLSQPTVRLRPERAWHVVGGLQRFLPGGVNVRVDGYYRRFRDLVVGRIETADERQARLATYDIPASLWASVPTDPLITVVPGNDARGDARGLEVMVTRNVTRRSPLSGWASYAISRARRTMYNVTMPFDYDRRHTVSAVASLRFGPRVDLAMTGRWASGLPRTAAQGVRLSLVADTEDVDGDGNRSELVPLRDSTGAPLFQPDLGSVTDINRARQPSFGRIDARVTYRPSWGRERWTFHLDLLNLLNARNVSLVDSGLVLAPDSGRPDIAEVPGDRGIPFLPSLGVRFTF